MLKRNAVQLRSVLGKIANELEQHRDDYQGIKLPYFDHSDLEGYRLKARIRTRENKIVGEMDIPKKGRILGYADGCVAPIDGRYHRDDFTRKEGYIPSYEKLRAKVHWAQDWMIFSVVENVLPSNGVKNKVDIIVAEYLFQTNRSVLMD